jgi:hypothetical protein
MLSYQGLHSAAMVDFLCFDSCTNPEKELFFDKRLAHSPMFARYNTHTYPYIPAVPSLPYATGTGTLCLKYNGKKYHARNKIAVLLCSL